MTCGIPHQTIAFHICDFLYLCVNYIKCIRLKSICVTHLPDSYVCCWVREGSFEGMTQLEGIRVNLCDVVQHHQDSSQRVDTGEKTNVTKEKEELQVVVKCTLKENIK